MAFIGVDVGGTFTDFVAADTSGELRSWKVLSTPQDPAIAVFEGLKEFLATGGAHVITHGSTVATNALLERKGARTALITTRGFEDVIEIGRQTRPSLYDLNVQKPAPLVPSELRFGVRERIGAEGEIVEALDEDSLAQVIEAVRAAGVESVAVCLLFSFLYPAHERRVVEMAAAMADTVHVSASCEILPEFREFERCSTTVVNAYLAPKVGAYMHSLAGRLGGNHLRIMQSNGGSISPTAAGRQPVRTILSGPAGGVIGAAAVARQAGHENIITIDMGGTSTDVSLVRGQVQRTTETAIDGWPIRVPAIDIHIIGAGGGSIAWLDAGGALRVGPQSAGADPGPACYGTGDLPTVTDANLVLGRLGPEPRLGGAMTLDAARAQQAIETLAREAGLDTTACAEGIIAVANTAMERALRVMSVERGHDPRDFCLVAFGGAGPLHAAELAAATQIPTVLVPAAPGVLSAWGMLMADVTKDYSRTVMRTLEPNGPANAVLEEVEAAFDALARQASEDMTAEGFAEDELRIERRLDVRYKGQAFELTVPFSADSVRCFHRAHKTAYGYSREDEPVEIVTVRLTAIGEVVKPPMEPTTARRARGAPDRTGDVMLFRDGEWLEAGVYDRAELAPGHAVAGPAAIAEATATTFVPRGFTGAVDAWTNILLTSGGAQA